jgi:hypothetical protein
MFYAFADFIETKIRELASSPRLPEYMGYALEKTILYPSIMQSAKGIVFFS